MTKKESNNIYRLNVVLEGDIVQGVLTFKQWVREIKKDDDYNIFKSITYNEIKNKYHSLYEVLMDSKPLSFSGNGYKDFTFYNKEDLDNSMRYFEKLYKIQKIKNIQGKV